MPDITQGDGGGGLDPDAAARAAGRHLFAQSCDFLWGAEREDGLPPPTLPEVAFAGRSNVGKSSLINALTGRKTLARVSHTPGRTQQINFFTLGERLCLVDLPGYGFAAVSRKRVEGWHALIGAYLRGRVPLRRVCLLVDARHGPKPSDTAVMDMLDTAAVPYQLLLTKADDVSREALDARTREVEAMLKKHPAAFPSLLVTSSRTGLGVEEVRTALAALAVPSALKETGKVGG